MKRILKLVLSVWLLAPLALLVFTGLANAQETPERFEAAARGFGNVRVELANGGDGYYVGAKEKRNIKIPEYYDWVTTMNMIKEIEPNIVFFSDFGPDIRWCGNEKGYVGDPNWCMINNNSIYNGTIGKTKNDYLNHGYR